MKNLVQHQDELIQQAVFANLKVNQESIEVFMNYQEDVKIRKMVYNKLASYQLRIKGIDSECLTETCYLLGNEEHQVSVKASKVIRFISEMINEQDKT